MCCGNNNNKIPGSFKSIPNLMESSPQNGETLVDRPGPSILQKNDDPDPSRVKMATNRPVGNNFLQNIVHAAVQQPNKVAWFVEGLTGLKKCVSNEVDLSPEQIQSNRETCKGCEFSSKTDGKVTTTSQCMAPDPAKGNKPCGCFILCKTQVGACPLNKWVNVTIKGDSPLTPNGTK
jgi:hypothetical protein